MEVGIKKVEGTGEDNNNNKKKKNKKEKKGRRDQGKGFGKRVKYNLSIGKSSTMAVARAAFVDIVVIVVFIDIAHV